MAVIAKKWPLKSRNGSFQQTGWKDGQTYSLTTHVMNKNAVVRAVLRFFEEMGSAFLIQLLKLKQGSMVCDL